MATDTEIKPKLKLNVEQEMEMIRTAPIMEVAEYFSGDLNLAVQLRVDTAVEDTYDKISARQGIIAEDIYKKWAAELKQTNLEISVRPIAPQGNLYGFASVTIGGIKIDDFKIVKNKDGEFFVGMPSKPDKTSKTGYRNTVYIENEFKEGFNKAVIGKYYEVVEQAQIRASNLKTAPTKQPESMAYQVAEAQTKADKHNADIPAKSKITPTRYVR